MGNNVVHFACDPRPFGGGGQFHKGIDFDANTGDPVLAVADGVVTFAGVRNGYGNVIEVSHRDNKSTLFAHLSRIDVHQSRRERRVDLSRGEAIFDVAKDPGRPFVVDAGQREVVAVFDA